MCCSVWIGFKLGFNETLLSHTYISKWVGLSSALEACSVYGDITWSVHTVNNLSLFSYQWHVNLCKWGPYVRLTFMPIMLSSRNKIIIIIIITEPYFENIYENVIPNVGKSDSLVRLLGSLENICDGGPCYLRLMFGPSCYHMFLPFPLHQYKFKHILQCVWVRFECLAYPITFATSVDRHHYPTCGLFTHCSLASCKDGYVVYDLIYAVIKNHVWHLNDASFKMAKIGIIWCQRIP